MASMTRRQRVSRVALTSLAPISTAASGCQGRIFNNAPVVMAELFADHLANQPGIVRVQKKRRVSVKHVQACDGLPDDREDEFGLEFERLSHHLAGNFHRGGKELFSDLLINSLDCGRQVAEEGADLVGNDLSSSLAFGKARGVALFVGFEMNAFDICRGWQGDRGHCLLGGKSSPAFSASAVTWLARAAVRSASSNAATSQRW